MKKNVIMCLAAFLCWGAAAQERVVEIDLETAISIALDENPTIKIADMEIERQQLIKKETKGNFLPTVSADAQYSYAVKKNRGFSGSMAPDNTVSIASSVGLPLVVPALFQTLKLNDEQMRAAVESARASRISLINEVTKSYYQILLAEQSMTVLRSSEQNVKQTVEDIRMKFESELASEYDLLTAEVQLSNLQPTIVETENSIKVSKKMLGMLLDLPSDITVNVKGNLNEMKPNNMGKQFSREISGNTDLRALDIQSAILDRQLKVQRTTRMPSLSAFGSFSPYGAEEIQFGAAGIGAGDFKWSFPINVGLKMSIPIFAGNTRVLKERQMQNSMRQLDYQRHYLEQNLNVQLDNAINAIITAEEKMAANQKTIEQAERGYNIMKVRYDAGMGTILELNSAELQLTQARLNHTQAIYDYLSAYSDYEKLLGKEEINQ